MIGRAVSVLGGSSRRTRWLIVAALSLVVLLIVVMALAPAPRPARRSARPATDSRRSVQAPNGPGSSALVSASEIDDARRVAGRFLAGYLPFLYGRGSARSVEGVTHALRLHVLRTRALVTPVERGRRPRVVSLTAVRQAPGVVLATALVADGGVTSYALRITLGHGRPGRLVSGVEGG